MRLFSDVQSHGSAGRKTAATEQKDEEIEEEDDNMLVKLERPRLRREFFEYLEGRTSDINGLVSQHLSLQRHQQCIVADRSKWLHGDFNVCIPISISNWRAQRVLMRCPFPHMLGLRGSDNMDEKIRCEAATFTWIPQNCSPVPIPRLWGFGLPTGLCFTPRALLPWYLRVFEHIKDWWAWLCRRPRCAPFLPHKSPFSLKSGYLIVDFIEKEQGTMLSSVWPPDSDEQKRNFYKSLSRVFLNLACCPLARIGSFTINNSGEMSLTNRPLTLRLPLLENEGIPTDIPRDRCYSTTDSYLRALLNCHDLKLRHQPNAIRDQYDARFQMAVLTILRTILSHYTQAHLQEGPFFCLLTDLNPGNFMVDRHCNITSIVDVEWCCSLPIEMQHPPFWLSGHAVDDLDGEKERKFQDMCVEFLDIFEQEERVLGSDFCTNVMRVALEMKSHWLWACLREPRATCNIFCDHLQPQYPPVRSEEEEQAATHSEEEEDNRQIQFQQIVASYFTAYGTSLVKQKSLDRNDYVDKLRSQHSIRYP